MKVEINDENVLRYLPSKGEWRSTKCLIQYDGSEWSQNWPR